MIVTLNDFTRGQRFINPYNAKQTLVVKEVKAGVMRATGPSGERWSFTDDELVNVKLKK